jgi:hypothetical protein
VRQGDALSPAFFVVCLAFALSRFAAENAGCVSEIEAYADDVVFIVEMEENCADAVAAIESTAACIGLRIEHSKTECLKLSYEN